MKRRRSLPSAWLVLLLLADLSCHKHEAVKAPPTPPSDGLVMPPAPLRVPRLPDPGPTAKKYKWLGPAVAFGTWVTIPSLWLVTGWRATPGMKARVQVDWPGPQTPNLCVMTGTVDPDDWDLDEAHATLQSCPKPNANGLSDGSLEVPAKANVVWLTLHSSGTGPATMKLKIDVEEAPQTAAKP